LKKILPLIAVVILFATCKKGGNTTPTTSSLDVVGSWTAYSYQTNAGNINVSVAQYPCMSDNVLMINADQTTETSYIGADTCYISAQHTGTSGVTTFGVPGQAPYAETWHRSGNDIYIGTEHMIISSENGKLYLTAHDTINNSGASPLIVATVEVKE
jgi:hypothetical protein